MALQDLLNHLLPKNDKFLLMLEQHGEVLGDAVKALVALVDSSGDPQVSLEGISHIEHRGDDLVHAVTIALQETFVTPLDRSDLYSLATSLDSVLDYIYSAADAFVTYEVRTFSPAMRELVFICSEAALALKDAVPYIRKQHLDKVAPVRLQIVALEKRSDAIYQAELAALFKNPDVDAKELLRQQAVLDALEAALDSCQDAADLLENIAIKHA
jgi:predicted phosphate transport protein (TIGR00153 family)